MPVWGLFSCRCGLGGLAARQHPDLAFPLFLIWKLSGSRRRILFGWARQYARQSLKPVSARKPALWDRASWETLWPVPAVKACPQWLGSHKSTPNNVLHLNPRDRSLSTAKPASRVLAPLKAHRVMLSLLSCASTGVPTTAGSPVLRFRAWRTV